MEIPQEEGMLHLQVRFRGAQLQREKKKHHERIVGLPAEAKEVLTRYLYLYGDACAAGSDTRSPGSLWPWQARWLTHCLSSLAKEGRIKRAWAWRCFAGPSPSASGAARRRRQRYRPNWVSPPCASSTSKRCSNAWQDKSKRNSEEAVREAELPA